MSNDFLNKSNMKKILLLSFAVILMFVFIQKFGTVLVLLERLINIVFPFILGACIAFIFNVPMSRIEYLLFKDKKMKGKRAISYLITLILIAAVIAAALFVIIPKIVETAKLVAVDFQHMGSLEDIKNMILTRIPQLKPTIQKLDLSYENLVKQVVEIFSGKASNIVGSTVGVLSSVVSGVATFLIGFTFSIYVLFRKEALAVQVKQIIYALFPEHVNKKILKVAHLSYETFSHFIRGQVLEACILGLMFFVTMSIIRMPYALLVAVLIAITALIPIFGAFIGCGISVLLILIVSPKQALIFIFVFLLLQQIEGKLIYPHVVGSSVGLPSIWVLFAITVGGELLGIAGMLIFVPLCSVIYALFREFIHNRLNERKIPVEKYLNK
ncbi:MAG: AI-2E family transporter [Clostridia bacterium]|nr:AI-2E family transporter [Clostridia bacterium]